MRRRDFLRAGAASALATPALAAPAIAQSAPEIKCRLTSSFSKTMETMFGTSQVVCRYIAVKHRQQVLSSSTSRRASRPAVRR